MEPPLLRTSDAPDTGALILPDADLHTLLMLALRRYLLGGATITKDAPLKARAFRQFTVGTVPIFLQQAEDVAGNPPYVPAGAYIALLIPEAHTIRFTNDGQSPSATYGMPVVINQALYITSQDLATLQICGTVAGCTVNIEYYEVDA